MIILASLVSVVVLIGSGKTTDPPKKPPTTEAELQQLQGTWQVEAWEESGKALLASTLKKRKCFFGGNVLLLGRGDELLQVCTAQLDPSKSPRTVNLSVKAGEGKDGVMLGIYSLDGDTLKLCFDRSGQSRPSDFKPEAKSAFTLIALKKVKPELEEKVDIVGKYRSELIDAMGQVTVTEVVVQKHGDAYVVTYRLDDKVLFVGIGIRRGDQFSMSWVSAGQGGISVYKIEAGPKLVGEYTMLGGIGMFGKEELTLWKKSD